MNFAKRKIYFFSSWSAAMLFVGSCGELSINNGDATPGPRTLAIASATNETPLILTIGASAVLDSDGTENIGCQLAGANASGTTSSVTEIDTFLLDSTNQIRSALVTFATRVYVNKLKMRLRLEGSPGSNYVADFRSVSGGYPTGTVVDALTGASFAAGGIDSGASGALKSFTLASPGWYDAGTYALTLRATANTGIDAFNYVEWMNSSGVAGCSGTSAAQFYNGAAWSSDPNGSGPRRPAYEAEVRTYATEGVVSWIMSGYSNAIWNMSTFNADENPASASGDITYDYGAGTSTTTPAYSQTGKTQAEVQAGSNVVGQFFYLRAHINSAAPQHDTASLGDVVVNVE